MTIPLSYEYERDDYYCYPGNATLKNKLDLKDEKLLNEAERKITSYKISILTKNMPGGDLDLEYLKQLHKFLFSDIYPWAGEFRRTDISKGNIFCQHELIEVNAEVLMNELRTENYLTNTKAENMADRLAYYLGDLNTIHPFREGNGRVQRLFILELAARAGYSLTFEDITPAEMIAASDRAFHYDYEPLEKLIARNLRKV